jgi:hypothetical protein
MKNKSGIMILSWVAFHLLIWQNWLKLMFL